jgi:alpha-tubulin suppressor-like RCC1 family protein
LTHDRHRLYSFGRADYGQLGIGFVDQEGAFRSTPQLVLFPFSEPVKVLEINAGERHAMVITEEQELYTWGFNEEGATGHVDVKHDIFSPRKLDLMQHVRGDDISHCDVVGMSCGAQHSLVLAQFFRKST